MDTTQHSVTHKMKDLENVFFQGALFWKLLRKKLLGNDTLLKQFREATTLNEKAELKRKSEVFANVKFKDIPPGQWANHIRMVDLMASFAARVMPEKELAGMISSHMKDETSITVLSSINAGTIARLCGAKAPAA